MTTQEQNNQDRRTRADLATDLAYQFSGERTARGVLAGLRRMNADSPSEAVFWQFVTEKEQRGEILENKWALIMQGIALMTGTADSHSAHDGKMPIGRALFYGGDESRTSAFYSEDRLNRLLAARGPILRALLGRMFRMMASANQSFDWREMARFILSDGHNEEQAERARRNIARWYYRTKYEAEPERNKSE